MVAGIDLIKRVTNQQAYCVTTSLLLDQSGNKIGKTAGGALWLDPMKTLPNDFYQFFYNMADAELEQMLLKLTFEPLEKIFEVL